MRRRFSDVLLGALAVVLLATTLAEIRNHFSPNPLPLLTAWRIPLPAGVLPIGLGESKMLLDRQAALFIDAREPERYRSGHIRGALSIPLADLATHLPDPDTLARLKAVPEVVVYCDGPQCRAAEKVAAMLSHMGARRLRVLLEGWPAWETAGYPAGRGDRP